MPNDYVDPWDKLKIKMAMVFMIATVTGYVNKENNVFKDGIGV